MNRRDLSAHPITPVGSESSQMAKCRAHAQCESAFEDPVAAVSTTAPVRDLCDSDCDDLDSIAGIVAGLVRLNFHTSRSHQSTGV